MKWTTAAVAFITLLVCAQPHVAAADRAKSAPRQVVSICAINRNPDAYVGKVVTVSGIYDTDLMVYEYIEDKHCNRLNILPIGYRTPERDASVVAFRSALDKYCKMHNNTTTCAMHDPITVRGLVIRTKGAHLQSDAMMYAINLHSVVDSWLENVR